MIKRYEHMEMPTLCQHCGRWFDLNDGTCSDKWYPDTTICSDCGRLETAEIEEDRRREDINMEVSNAMHDVHTEKAWNRLTMENRKLLRDVVSQSKPIRYEFRATVEGTTYRPKGFYYQGKFVILVGDEDAGHTIRRKEYAHDVEIEVYAKDD